MGVTTYLHGGVGWAGGVCRGGDSREEGASREGDFGGGGGAEGDRAFVYLKEGGSFGCDPGRDVEGWRLLTASRCSCHIGCAIGRLILERPWMGLTLVLLRRNRWLCARESSLN